MSKKTSDSSTTLLTLWAETVDAVFFIFTDLNCTEQKKSGYKCVMHRAAWNCFWFMFLLLYRWYHAFSEHLSLAPIDAALWQDVSRIFWTEVIYIGTEELAYNLAAMVSVAYEGSVALSKWKCRVIEVMGNQSVALQRRLQRISRW